MRGVPELGDVSVGKTTRQLRYYVCRERHAPLVPFGEAGLRLFAYERNKLDPSDPLVVTATLGPRTDTITIGLGCGGCIQSWETSDLGSGYDVQFLSTAGTSRGLGASMERVEANGDEYHPYMAGSKFDGAGQEGVLPDGYASADVIQGSPLVSHSVFDKGGGEKLIRTAGLAVEWDPNGEIFGTDHHGDCFNVIVYPDLYFIQDIAVNFGGTAGLHRITQRVVVPDHADLGDITRVFSPQMHTPFMWDELYSYDGSTYTQQINQEMESAISESPSFYTYPLGTDFVDVTMSSSHGRNAGTQHWLTISGASGSPTLNGDWFVEWLDSQVFRITFPGHGTYTGGTVTAAAVQYEVFPDTETRDAFTDDLVLSQPAHTTSRGDNDLGTYVGRGIFGSGDVNAALLRAMASGPNAWSINTDFAIALVAPSGGVDARNISGGAAGRRGFRFQTERGDTTPTSSPTAVEHFFLARMREWDETMVFRKGTHENVSWLVTGTWSEVQSLVSGLDV